MRELIYHTKKNGKTLAKIWLTTERPESHYGIPVLEAQVQGHESSVYGWFDVFPSGMPCHELIFTLLNEVRVENQVDCTQPRKHKALQLAAENIKAMMPLSSASL